MTKSEILLSQNVDEVFTAIKENEAIANDADIRSHFAKLSHKQFEASVIAMFGEYSPEAHYDFGLSLPHKKDW